MLEQIGYRAVEAGDGAEALRILESNEQVQLVLTDMIMPEMSGTELARRLAEVRPDLRVLFMSGYTDDPVVRKVGLEPSIFLSKPFTATDLARKIRQALDMPWAGVPNL